jgi:integrase
MGRTRSLEHVSLPPRMHRKGNSYYYVTTSNPRKWIPLGDQITDARLEWARIENKTSLAIRVTLDHVAAEFFDESKNRLAPRTLKDYSSDYVTVSKVFGHMTFDEITRRHIVKFRDTLGKTSSFNANRSRALLGALWSFALDKCFTEKENIIPTIKKCAVKSRDRYVSDEEYNAVLVAAPKDLALLLEFSLLTGQRPADVVAVKAAHVDHDYVSLVQSKTGKALRIRIVGQLADLMLRIREWRKNSSSPYLHVDETGVAMTYAKIRRRFERARQKSGVSFRLVDLRAKAATDLDDISSAQSLLGHNSPATTKIYRRDKRGDIVDPLR